MFNKNKKIFFSKMHGLGNDFVIIDTINQNVLISSDNIREWSNRNTGIGFDQLLLVEQSNDPNIDFNYRIFNSDASEVYQCGNGARCFAYFVYLKKLTNKKDIIIKTYSKIMSIKILNKKNIMVNMGVPKLYINDFTLIPLINNIYYVNIENLIVMFNLVWIGNPHCVIFVQDINTCLVHKIGKFLNNRKDLFPYGINVNFIQVVSSNNILLRVYERGTGETQACGSGACAAVIAGIALGILSYKVQVTLFGGNLIIKWDRLKNIVYMIGPVDYVYDGYIYL